MSNEEKQTGLMIDPSDLQLEFRELVTPFVFQTCVWLRRAWMERK